MNIQSVRIRSGNLDKGLDCSIVLYVGNMVLSMYGIVVAYHTQIGAIKCIKKEGSLLHLTYLHRPTLYMWYVINLWLSLSL